LASSGAAASGALVSRLPSFAFGLDISEFQWKTADLVFKFNVATEKLRQKRLLPADYSLPDLGIKITLAEGALNVEFPRPRLACVITDRVLN
jgi:hypothetical protein